MSEKSTRKAPDYAVESRAARNRSVFRPQLQHWSCNTHQERYNSSESVQKKEIPVRPCASRGSAFAHDNVLYHAEKWVTLFICMEG